MNCKIGDIVRYVGDVHRENVYGWIGVVKQFRAVNNGEPAWVVEPSLPGGQIIYKGYRRSGNWVFDKNLRPIRDPGDDAQDETLQWLPVPSTKETA